MPLRTTIFSSQKHCLCASSTASTGCARPRRHLNRAHQPDIAHVDDVLVVRERMQHVFEVRLEIPGLLENAFLVIDILVASPAAAATGCPE